MNLTNEQKALELLNKILHRLEARGIKLTLAEERIWERATFLESKTWKIKKIADVVAD